MTYPLSNVLEVPSPELAKRLRYTKDRGGRVAAEGKLPSGERSSAGPMPRKRDADAKYSYLLPSGRHMLGT